MVRCCLQEASWVVLLSPSEKDWHIGTSFDGGKKMKGGSTQNSVGKVHSQARHKMTTMASNATLAPVDPVPVEPNCPFETNHHLRARYVVHVAVSSAKKGFDIACALLLPHIFNYEVAMIPKAVMAWFFLHTLARLVGWLVILDWMAPRHAECAFWNMMYHLFQAEAFTLALYALRAWLPLPFVVWAAGMAVLEAMRFRTKREAVTKVFVDDYRAGEERVMSSDAKRDIEIRGRRVNFGSIKVFW